MPRHVIRAATTAQDVAHAGALFEEYAARLGVSLCFQDFDHELATLPGHYAAPQGGLWLAGAPAPLGCVALRPLAHDASGVPTPGVAEIKRLYVRDEARGTGLGRALAQTALDGARARGYRLVKLDTLAQMDAARALYASLGFRPCAAYYDNPLGGTLYMELPLG